MRSDPGSISVFRVPTDDLIPLATEKVRQERPPGIPEPWEQALQLLNTVRTLRIRTHRPDQVQPLLPAAGDRDALFGGGALTLHVRVSGNVDTRESDTVAPYDPERRFNAASLFDEVVPPRC